MDNDKKKLILQFIPLVFIGAVIVVAVFALFNDSFTWFSNNKEVTAGGMQIKSDVTSNLIISKKSGDVTDQEIATNSLLSVSYDSVYSNLKGLHRENDKYFTADYTNVNAALGTSTALTEVSVENLSDYCAETTFYIGSAGYDLKCDSIVVSFNSSKTTKISEKSSDNTYFLNCVCVDVICDDTFVGTLKLTNNLDQTLTINKNLVRKNSPIEITLRAYYDGSLTDSTTGKAYLRSGIVNDSSVEIGLTFTAVNPETSK